MQERIGSLLNRSLTSGRRTSFILVAVARVVDVARAQPCRNHRDPNYRFDWGAANFWRMRALTRGLRRTALWSLGSALLAPAPNQTAHAQALRVALAKQAFSPTGTSSGLAAMASGGVQEQLTKLGATLRVDEAKLTASQDTEYGAWKRLGWALGDFAKIVAQNERDGYFTVGLYATCPSMPGMVAGLEHSGTGGRPLRVGMLWLDAHPDFNTPETTRSGSMGGMPVAIATGRALKNLRVDATLDPPLRDEDVVMAGVRLTDPLEQDLLDHSKIQQLSVEDVRKITPAIWRQLDRLNAQVDKLYIHIDMDVLDPREVSMHVNKVPGGPSSEELAALLEQIFARYPKATAVGFATLPPSDPGGLSIAALNRMIVGAVRGVGERQGRASRSSSR